MNISKLLHDATRALAFGLIGFVSCAVASEEPWQTALKQMPLRASVAELNRTNCVPLLLEAVQSNEVVKALVFMPGATDEFYMFRRAKAALTNSAPSLFDAVRALTNQTLIRVTFRAPLLLLHTDEDPLEPAIVIENEPAVARLKSIHFAPHALYNDRDWDFIQPILARSLKADIRPWRYNYDTWHFYRHSFAGWNLSGWEALQAVALAGKTCFTVQRVRGLTLRSTRIVFSGDERVRATPKVDFFPK